MESSTTRNKVEARRIESWLHSQIAELGTTNIAKVAGVNKSTVSRWRESLLPNMSLLLAILISNRTGEKVTSKHEWEQKGESRSARTLTAFRCKNEEVIAR